MLPVRHFMVKVVLVGDKAVGKTSLIRRYVLDQFGDEYITTLGMKVSKKVLELNPPDGRERVSLNMNIWDIMGQGSLRELAKEAYFHGARGILAVVDVTRRDTLEGIADWIRAVKDVAGSVPMILVANKKDLEGQAAFGSADVAGAAETFRCPSFFASAKTGENVEGMFHALADLILRDRSSA